MSKYECPVIKETNNLFEVQRKDYYESLYTTIKDFYQKGGRITIGKQWIRVFDSRNSLPLFEERAENLKAFLKYCKDKGRIFKKKL